MIPQLLRITFVTYLWKRYRAFIVSTLVLILFIWITGRIHEDYIAYAELNDDRDLLALSFIVKWSVYALGAAVYLIFNLMPRKKAPQRPGAEDDLIQSLKPKTAAAPDTGLDAPGKQDPFAPIRQKDRLRSRADLIITSRKRKR